MSIAISVDVQRFFHGKVHVSDWAEQFEELAIGNGCATMEVHNLERMIDGGVQLAVCSERLGKVSRFHDWRDPALPRDVGTDNIHDAASNALGRRIVRSR